MIRQRLVLSILGQLWARFVTSWPPSGRPARIDAHRARPPGRAAGVTVTGPWGRVTSQPLAGPGESSLPGLRAVPRQPAGLGASDRTRRVGAARRRARAAAPPSEVQARLSSVNFGNHWQSHRDWHVNTAGPPAPRRRTPASPLALSAAGSAAARRRRRVAESTPTQ
jgi:hypothetical protein